ncbi:serine/threonine-protein kinase [Nonomuraea sp. NPDC049646]|uniref:serine/threonine-protein kinase n=1 Tax=unclassified Nonomuraea TaxID=2593643 RepID=UPI0037927AB4
MHKRVIDNRFELTERLGGGGMGLVWRAWDTALHREVALKEVRPPDPAFEEHDPEAARELRARVLREARALARLNHPHVATIHHIVDPGGDGYPWIVMELVTGGSLQDRLARGPMTPWETARLGREVLSALRAAHAVGIQHRDVKPANVLLREDGRSVLTDFGIAAVRESTSLTATGSFIGSPEYMAPERINGHEGDPASDLWSLGMLLYVAVEGRHPLRRSTTLATLAAVLNQDVPPPERAGPLGPVLGALLRRDPAGRPDAETLDRMLAAAADPGAAPPAYPPPAPQPAPAPLQPGPPSAPSGPLHQGHFPPSPGPLRQGPPYGATVPPGARQGATVPPGGPRPWGPEPSFSQAGTMASRRARRSPVAAVTASVGALAVTGVLVYTLLPGVRGAEEPTQPNTPQITPVETTDVEEPKASEEPQPQPENLLTADGVRAAIKALKPVMGGTKVVRMVVYPTYISAEAPVKDDPGVYDRYAYRDGKATHEGPGSTIRTPTVDLAKYNWDALPGLFKKAQSVLGVRKPTARYVIIDPDYVFTNPKQVMLIYLTDAYRTGYLAADPQGRVLKTVPAS